MRIARGPLRIPLPSMPGPKTLCGDGAGTSGFLSSADKDLEGLLESPQGSQSSSPVVACTCAFLPSCSSSVTLPLAWIKGSVAFPRGFPTRFSHEAFPQGCPTCHHSKSPPDVSVHSRGNCFPFTPRIDSHHGGTWDSPVGKPRGKSSRECHRSLVPREWKCDTATTAGEESARACPHSRRGLTPLGRLHKYPKIHVNTGEESSGSGTDSTQGLRPRLRRERNPERPPNISHGDWPFLRPPERVPEFPVVSREHLLQLEKMQEVLTSRRDEAHFR